MSFSRKQSQSPEGLRSGIPLACIVPSRPGYHDTLDLIAFRPSPRIYEEDLENTSSPKPVFPLIQMMRSVLSIFILAALLLPAAGEIDFNRDIRPIISDRCFKCHGPDASNQKSEFRIDTLENAIADMGGYSGILPGNLEESEVHHRIWSDDPDDVMPPPDSKLALSEKERKLLDRWIREGASYDTHWSFKPIPREIPVPRTEYRARTPIDSFIHAGMKEAGLEPSADTSPESWLRRVTFDLTGLPPKIAELDTFLARLADFPERADAIYAQTVDRLLKTEAYAERMTSEWLDVARYSDTYGYQVDRDRFVWPWRDWVINSFRKNLPYDQFIIEQLAGDLLPHATKEQIQATTFNRLHPQKVEGGSVPEEFRIEYVADRLHTFGTAFLGLTLECSRCHDHKYDPITAKNYYELSSFFANIDEAGLYSYFTPSVPTPTLLLTSKTQDRQIAEKEKSIQDAQAAVVSIRENSEDAFEKWLSERPGEARWHDLQADVPFDNGKGGKFPDLARSKQTSSSTRNVEVEGKVGKGLRLTGDHAVHVVEAGRFSRTQPFTIGLWLKTPKIFPRSVVWRRSRAWTDAGSRGYELLLEEGRPSVALVHFHPGNSIRVRASKPLPLNTWKHVVVTYDGSSRAAGLRLWLDGRPLASEIVYDKLTKSIEGGGEPDLKLGERFRDTGFQQGEVDELQIFTRELTPLEVAHMHDRRTLQTALTTAPGNLSNTQRAGLYEFFLSTTHEPYRNSLAKLKAVRDELRDLLNPIAEIMVMEEAQTRRQSYLLERGVYDARGQKVAYDTPEVLPPFPKDQPRNRLGLARWLTTPDHPLTARVTVNRYWQMFFGNGLVRTPEDFGSQGRLPSHPGLLDWLARDFITHGWDVHHLTRRIVLSSTYRQVSIADKRSREIDPENIYLARGTADRLSAEMIRDNALALSELLVNKTGGPSVKPYEVAVSFKPANPGKGDDLYRRSVYTWWKRTGPAPVMMTLNASKRDVCRVRREVTPSPLQAFVLLNGPQFMEASRVMAANLLRKHKGKTSDLIAEAYRAFTSRTAKPAETKILRTLYDEQLAHYQANPDQAAGFLGTGASPEAKDLPAPDVAAATILVNAIMNLDEAVSKR